MNYDEVEVIDNISIFRMLRDDINDEMSRYIESDESHYIHMITQYFSKKHRHLKVNLGPLNTTEFYNKDNLLEAPDIPLFVNRLHSLIQNTNIKKLMDKI